jgi:hypothetical protein
MALGLVLSAMTHQRDPTTFCEGLKQPKRELLSMVLDRFVSSIDRACLK